MKLRSHFIFFGIFCGDSRVAARNISVLVVAAHPDDEIVGMGVRLAILPRVSILHVTDGAPANMRDAHRLGFERRDHYAAARYRESIHALKIAGISSAALSRLCIPDQEVSANLVNTTDRILRLIRQIKPDVVVTHPYEGGHPDHDATAFSVHAALHLLNHQPSRSPVLIEFTSYHLHNGGLETYEFLNSAQYVRSIFLSPEERELKIEMLACHVTQRAVLAAFPVQLERFRLAPRYNFRRPPHEGPLYYELFDWGMTGRRWTCQASAALEALGISEDI